jgi:hypothetical protein
MSLFDDLIALEKKSPPEGVTPIDGQNGLQDTVNEASVGQTGLAADNGASRGLMSTQANVFGGMNVLHNGVMVGHSYPNVFGGIDVNHDGIVDHWVPNVFGGMDHR